MSRLDLKAGADGDLDLTSGDLAFSDDLGDRIAQRLRFIQGEWFLDLKAGVPYLRTILVKNPNLAHVRAAFRHAILGTHGVAGLRELALDFDRKKRKLSVAFKALDAAGLEATRSLLL